MKNEVLCAARILPCELLDMRPSALDYAIQDVTHNLTNSVMCELEKGELICSLQCIEQYQLTDFNAVKIRRKVTLKRLVRCKDCKHWNAGAIGICKLHDIRPTPIIMDDWFCADGERKEE